MSSSSISIYEGLCRYILVYLSLPVSVSFILIKSFSSFVYVNCGPFLIIFWKLSKDKEEKEAYVNALVARINAGESFEAVAESGDNRLIFTGTGIEFAKSIEEHSAGFLLEQKLGGSEEASEIVKKTEAGKLSEVIDTGDVFQLVLVEKVEDGVVGEAKDELVELLISQYANELIYQVVKDMEVNNAAVSRITIK